MTYEEYRPIIDAFVDGLACPKCPHYRTEGEFETCDVINSKVGIEGCKEREEE